METGEIISKLNKFNEEEELTPQKIKDIIHVITFDDSIFEDDSELTTVTLETMYNKYKACGFTDYGYVLSIDEYQNYIKDVCNEFAQCLPDGIDDFFPSNELYEYILNQSQKTSNSYLLSCIDFINKNEDELYDKFIKLDSGDFEGTGYVLIEEYYGQQI